MQDKLPKIYDCKNSYGVDGIMTDCIHELDIANCGESCEKFEQRQTPRNEDEVMQQSLEWD